MYSITKCVRDVAPLQLLKSRRHPEVSYVNRKLLSFAIKFAVSAILLWLLARGIDIDAVGRQMAGADPLWLIIAVFLAAAVIPMAAIRWQMVTQAIREPVSTRDAMSITTIGWFFNQTLPSTIGGDAVRVYLAYRTGITKTGAIHGILLDRLMGLFVVLALATIFLAPLLAGLDVDFQKWFLIAFIVAGYGGYAVLFLVSAGFATRLDNIRLGKLLRDLSRAARATLLSLSPGGIILVISVVLQIVQIASVYAIAVAVGVEVGFTAIMIALPAVLLVSSLPISLAGWGVREQSMVLALGAMGMGSTDALAISVLLGLSWIVIGLPGALVWLGHRRRGEHLGQAVEASATSAD
ncbi:MAG: flippase-like domain-containing protein [Alphaproteobacteria bacterium]|nr:flippase-like domain-containing protein [Alphaproteobacteria bacterium]